MITNSKIYLYTAIVCAIVLIVLFFQCGGNEPRVITNPSITEKTFERKLPPAPAIVIHDTLPRVVIKIPPQLRIDSQAIKQLLAERDSLTELLNSKAVNGEAVRITFSADTIHPITHDTLSIECDELKRHINYSLAYAPRTEKITIQTQTFIKEVTLWEKILYAACGFGLGELIRLFRN